MKPQLKFSLLSVFLMITAGIVTSGAQVEEGAGVPGDNFSLEGALEMFKKSTTPEQFEQMLNSQDNKVNNLDLNGDGQIDYIKVIDRNEGNIHTFILQAAISDTESQDVAVIELEKKANGKAVLQIIGDEDVYGTETIIEPTENVRVNAGTSTAPVVVNVWSWPSVQYVYGPYYSLYVSPWGWNAYPLWWSPWRPIAYYSYRPFWAPYRPYYSVCYTHRIGYASRIYRPYRSTSVIVYNRHHNQINQYRADHGNRHTYSSSSSRYDSRNNGRSGDYRSNSHSRRSGNNDDAGYSRRSSSDNRSRYNNGSSGSSDARSNDYRRSAPSNSGRQQSMQRSAPQQNRSTQTPGRSGSDFRSAPTRSHSSPSIRSGNGGGGHRPSIQSGGGGSRHSGGGGGGSHSGGGSRGGGGGGGGSQGSSRGRH